MRPHLAAAKAIVRGAHGLAAAVDRVRLARTRALMFQAMVAKNPRLYLLRGGYQAWKAEVLAPVVFGGETDAEQLRAKQQKEAVRAYFAGERPQSGKAAVLPVTPIRRDNAHKPAGAHEGC